MVVSDSELLVRWRADDAQAGEQLFERYFDPVKRFFANKVSGGLDDLIQETFLRCVKNRDLVEDGGRFRSYLFTIAYRVFVDHLRYGYRDGEVIDFAATSIQDLSPGASSLMARYEEQRLLLDALRRIPIASQVMLELHYWESLTVGEIAQIFDVPTPTAQGRLRRARERLDAAMSELAASPELLASTVHGFESWIERCRHAASELLVAP